MKRNKFIKHLSKTIVNFIEMVVNTISLLIMLAKKKTTIPSHPDIDEKLCAEICTQLNIPNFKATLTSGFFNYCVLQLYVNFAAALYA